jgi:DNA-binding SARP family transcriptional activator
MSIRLTLRLLGPFELQLKKEHTPKLGRKTRAILAYLVVTGESHPRRRLMEIFCPEAADPAGALRWHLSRIRRQLDNDILLATPDRIGINREIIRCDHLEFQQIMAQPATQTTANLNHAFRQYRGEFLQDLDLRDAPAFDIWLLGQRARYRQLFENGSQRLISRLVQQGQFDQAVSIAHALLQTNPLLEFVQTQLIWLYAHTGQRGSALQQFRHCQSLLWQELAVRPSPDLLALHEAIVHNQPLPALADETMLDAPVHLPGTAVSDFVGRHQEQNQLQTMWQSGGGVALIEAVAGGGKTRLMEEFCHTLPENVIPFIGRSYESTRSIPYQPWLHILKSFTAHQKANTLQGLAPRWQQQLNLLLPDLFSQTAVAPSQQELFRAIAYLLQELSPTQPMLIVLEDLQWADEVSLQLFQFMSQQRPRTTAPFLLIGTFRTEEVADNPALGTLLQDCGRDEAIVRLPLRPLIAAEVEQLVSLLWPDLPAGFRTPHIRDMLLQAAGGNPLFTGEILRELASVTELPGTLPIPPSLAELTTRRLNQLPASGRQVIESLAVLDRPAHFDLAQQISARTEEETLTAIEMGLRWRLLLPDEKTRIGFCHDLFRTAVLDQLSQVRRTILHRRAAEILAQWGADAATLAHHWRQAGNEANEAQYAAIAGAEAAALYANDEAIHYFERVLVLRPATTLWRQLGDVQKRIGQWEKAETAYRQALALSQSANAAYEQACANLALGKLLVARGDYDAAEVCLRQAENTFHQHDNQSELADTVNNQAIIAYRQGDYATALEKYKVAAQIDESLGDKHGMVIRLGNMGLVHLMQSKLDQAQNLLEQSLQLARELDHKEYIANRLGNLGVVASNRGDYDGALHLYQQAVAIDQELGHTQSVARNVGNMGVEYYWKGDYQQAIAQWHQALAMEQEMGNRRGEARLLGNLGEVYQAFGHFAPAERYLALALQMDLAAEHRDAVARHTGNLAVVYQRQELWQQAAQWVQPAIVIMRQLNDLKHLSENLYTAAQLAYHKGHLTEAEKLLHECLPLAEQKSGQAIYLPATILTIQLQVRRQAMTSETGIAQLNELLADWPEAKDQALLYDAIWELDPSQTAARDKAGHLFAEAYGQFPHVLYRQRHQALTGISLSLPALPPPPDSLPSPPDLNSLYEQLNNLLTT